jgi:hypothetical protein
MPTIVELSIARLAYSSADRRVAEFVAFDCTSQEKAAHGPRWQEVFKTASKDAQNGSYYPGNEHCGVK